MKYFKKMEADRLYLSPVNPEDIETYMKWINNLSLSLKIGSPAEVFSLPREQSVLENMAREGQNFAVVLKNNDELIGNCSLFAIDQVRRVAELGIFIGEDRQRGMGYGAEAIKLLCEYDFKILNLNNIMLRVFEFNEPAIKCYEKAGFRLFGRRSQSYLVNGKAYDELYMEILRDGMTSRYLDAVLP